MRYSKPAVSFHWITAVLVFVQVYLGLRFGLSEPSAARDEIFIWHKSVGVLILLVVFARLTYRLKNPPPPFPPELSAFERFAATWNHRLFYLLLIAMPVVGWVAVSGYANGPTTPLLGSIPVPVFPGVSKETGDVAGELHEMAAYLLVALLTLHLAAVLKHRFVDRWRGPARMPPLGGPITGQGRSETLREG